MLDHEALKSVAEQMSGTAVSLGEEKYKVSRTGSMRLRTVRFKMGGREYQAIEQNPEKPSRWGKMAREGKRVVQFRDVQSGKYVAVVFDGKVMEYGSGRQE
jgi:hypothetical protein